jgi:hypothetical protein
MVRSNFPVFIEPSRKVSERLGNQLAPPALRAIRAILSNRRGIEVAHQPIVYRGHHLALSSRVTAAGDLVVAIDLGDPALASRLILEDELRGAEHRARKEDRKIRDARRKLQRGTRRW